MGAGRRAGPRHAMGEAEPVRGTGRLMRAIFVVYMLLIAAGLTYFTIIGLTHH
jgi:hypothetical protein